MLGALIPFSINTMSIFSFSLNIDECIFIFRNILHFLMTSFVLIAYSFVELYALYEILIQGKKKFVNMVLQIINQ